MYDLKHMDEMLFCVISDENNYDNLCRKLLYLYNLKLILLYLYHFVEMVLVQKTKKYTKTKTK